MSSLISVYLDEDTNKALEEFTAANGISKADFVRAAVLEKLEDEEDIVLGNQAYNEWIEEGKKTISLSEMMKRYGQGGD